MIKHVFSNIYENQACSDSTLASTRPLDLSSEPDSLVYYLRNKRAFNHGLILSLYSLYSITLIEIAYRRYTDKVHWAEFESIIQFVIFLLTAVHAVTATGAKGTFMHNLQHELLNNDKH